ncbi:MAG: SH3 domain-containing protein [Flavobacteriaceae bacterium]|nr:SH3 domain-containing protein [Flavobacteriaceae bacterium]
MMKYCLIIILFFTTVCQGQNTKSEDCSEMLTELIYTSNIHNPSKTKSKLGIERFIARVDSINAHEMTVGFYIKNERENIVAWVVLKKEQKLMLNETVDPDNPVILKYNNELWNKVIACFFYNRINIDGLFNESSIIRFTPKDLNKNDPEIQEFKEKFKLYEAMNFKGEDFVSVYPELSLLISDRTFIHVPYFIDNSWLEYFVTKYKFKQDILNDLMKMAIDQEDFLAVKTLNKFYIFSQTDINNAKNKKQYKDSLNGKLDIKEGYNPTFSTIDKILPYITDKYSKNKISDPDGYTNLRKGKGTQTAIIKQIKSGEHIKVLDNTENWLFVEAMNGQKGYVYRDRVKSE